MKPARLVLRSALHHAPLHASTLAGVAVASAVLTGALVLGDSVRASLARAAELRRGRVEAVLGSGERFFGAGLAARLAQRVEGLVVSPAIQLPAVAARADGERRAGDVQLLGVEPGFFALAPLAGSAAPPPGDAWIGAELARELDLGPLGTGPLGAGADAELVLRVPRPSSASRELAFVSVEEAILPLRVRVVRILADEDFGAFSLEDGAGPRANLFVEREWLAGRLDVPGRANRCFLSGVGTLPGELEPIEAALRLAWEPEDVGLRWRRRPESSELVSDQVFLSEAVVASLRGLEPRALALTTYFVNALEAGGGRSTPYSTVAALEALEGAGEPPADPRGWEAAVADTDSIALNEWTARDLALEPGDEVTLRYFVLRSGRALEERSHAFRLGAVLPMEGLGADPSLAPEFPGIGDAENCRDWDPGLPVDLERIRDEDEAYWDLHRGAPKGFVAAETARALWANRFGSRTALRVTPAQEAEVVERLRALAPGELQLPLRVVSGEARGASDFGALFLGLSSFLVVSALLLTALFFAFSLERRAGELGILAVCGFPRREVARLQLTEAALLCLLGAGLGLPLGLGYTRGLLAALASVWRGAIGRTELVFVFEPASLGLAAALALVLALIAVSRVLARALSARPLALLWGELGGAPATSQRNGRGRVALVTCLALSLGLIAAALRVGGDAAGGLAFAGGLALLVAAMLAARARLHGRTRPRSLSSLGAANASRRPTRSLTTVGLVASSIFLLVVAGASRTGPTPRDSGMRSGTGGFQALARTSLPVLQDLRSPEGRSFYGLGAEELAGVGLGGVELVPLRARAGDEASCLNLDRPREPRLLGVPAVSLAGRFRFADALREVPDAWTLLEEDLGPGIVPAIVDATSLQWTIHARLGDDLALVDGRGQAFAARVVATLADSILQGDVLISERRFEERFPDEVGHRAFLIDAPSERVEALNARLSRALADEGLVVVPASERLDLLHSVQNTYLSIFQALGGLGLVLGSAGLLALVLRTAAERRGELALMRALGFTKGELAWLFVGEHGALVWIGLGVGALAGLAAALPRLGAGSLAGLAALAGGLVLVGLAGSAFAWIGSWLALRADPWRALSRE